MQQDYAPFSDHTNLEIGYVKGAEEPKIQKLYYASNPIKRYICQYSLTNITGEYDNPVDACVDMILKLKERNLL